MVLLFNIYDMHKYVYIQIYMRFIDKYGYFYIIL